MINPDLSWDCTSNHHEPHDAECKERGTLGCEASSLKEYGRIAEDSVYPQEITSSKLVNRRACQEFYSN